MSYKLISLLFIHQVLAGVIAELPLSIGYVNNQLEIELPMKNARGLKITDVFKVNMVQRNICPRHYYGDKCSVFCRDDDTNRYSCDVRTGEKLCSDGWKGDGCLQAISPCDSSPCLNNGVCEVLPGGTFHCNCPNPFYGSSCQHEKMPTTQKINNVTSVVPLSIKQGHIFSNKDIIVLVFAVVAVIIILVLSVCIVWLWYTRPRFSSTAETYASFDRISVFTTAIVLRDILKGPQRSSPTFTPNNADDDYMTIFSPQAKTPMGLLHV